MSEFFTETIVISILAAMVRIGAPLILAAIGELIAERAGVINLGVEGMMLMGCFLGFFVTFETGSILAGIGAAMVGAMLMSLIMAFMAITLRLEQFVTGLALNLLASGLTLFWFRSLLKTIGSTQPNIDLLEKAPIPFLSDIPYLGIIVFSHNWLVYLAILSVPICSFFLYKTKYGLELRCLGENPRAIDMKGLSVAKRQYLAVLFGGMMAGLAGAFISVGSSIRFVPEMTAGRGWLAIVIVIAGNWQPKWILVAALVFAFLEAFQMHVQAVGINFPYQILLALPYVVAVIALMHRRARSRAPASLGVAYSRGL